MPYEYHIGSQFLIILITWGDNLYSCVEFRSVQCIDSIYNIIEVNHDSTYLIKRVRPINHIPLSSFLLGSLVM